MEQEQTAVATAVPEIHVENKVNPVPPEISTDPRDFQKEIQKIAEEKGGKLVDGKFVPNPPDGTQVPEPQAAPKPEDSTSQPQAGAQPEVKVPEKFLGKDGQIDQEKLQKSTVNAEEAIKKYLEKERELRKLQNEVHGLEKIPPPQPQPQPQAQVPGAITPDAINEALRRTSNPGQVMYELAQLAAEDGYRRALSDFRSEIGSIRDRVESDQRTRELKTIADKDPWVFSVEGIQKLSEIRQAKPWLNNAPEPWKEAYLSYLADKQLGQASQVQMPNPAPTTVKAPATPVGGANRVQAQVPNFSDLANDKARLNAYLDTLTPEQQKSFWKTAIPGLRV